MSALKNFRAIASTSKGNCYVYGTLLVDFGVPANKIDTDVIEAALFTHAHGDHINISAFNKLMKAKIPIYANKRYKRVKKRSVMKDLSEEQRAYITYVDLGKDVEIESSVHDKLLFRSICEVEHDVPNHCYHIEVDDYKYFHVTDAGNLDDVELGSIVYDHMTIEANYCEIIVGKKLVEAEIKNVYCRFVRSIRSHLSVQQCMEFYLQNKGPKTTLYKAHKSDGVYTMTNYYKLKKKEKNNG